MDEGKKEEAPHKREKRKRIDYSEKLAGAEKIHDELEFKPSLGSKNARQIKTIKDTISLELWYDKHYIIVRNQHLDEEGNKRDVPPEAVEALVTRSLKHLLFYSAALKNFTFLNHADSQNKIRTIIKDSPGGKHLMISVEAHFLNFNT